MSRPHLPGAVLRLVAVLAAAGSEGVERDRLAIELWGDPPPDSWKSALRNRVTVARKILGVDAIENEGGRLRFAPFVTVDSWDLIAHVTSQFAGSDAHELSFLNGEPLAEIEQSDLVRAHIDQVADARAALVQEIVDAGTPLSPHALQALRSYQHRHPFDAIVTTRAVQAHLQAGLPNHATKLISEVRSLQSGAHRAELSWVANLDRLIAGAGPGLAAQQQSTRRGLLPSELAARAELFRAAARSGNWNLALEIATAGLPEAELSEGDPPRLELLEAIPLDRLEPTHQAAFCLAIARHLMYADRQDEAKLWSRTAGELAATPHDEMQSLIIAAMLDGSGDQRAPIPLPEGFASSSAETISLRSLQVVVMSHLERVSFADADPVYKRYTTLVESSGEPYRRWHLLLLESMFKFVNGELTAAAAAARTAYQYGELFGIADAELALLGQLSNAAWVHPAFSGVHDDQVEFPGATDRTLSRVLNAIETERSNTGAVDAFLLNYKQRTPSMFAFPVITLAAPYIHDPSALREVVACLSERTGTSAIYGSGVMHLGPVDRTLARLVASTDAAIAHLMAAITVADRQQMPLWQVVCRLDLSLLVADDESRRQAATLAVTPDLRHLVDEYTGVRAS